MSSRKHNLHLEGAESDDELDRGYDSEASAGRARISTSRASKRQKIDVASPQKSESDFDEVGGGSRHEKDSLSDISAKLAESGNEGENSVSLDEDRGGEGQIAKLRSLQSQKTTPKPVVAAHDAAQKSGVIYISRVPPFMKPQTLRHLLTPHAPRGIGRIFLTPEEQAAHARRVRSGGNKKKSYTDGWVEFTSKRDAKVVAETLNGNIIGGKKGNFYHDDLWNMKYLKGFKWSHLTEQIANENAERAARMREEVRRTRQENRAFVQDVERGKMLETIEAKRLRRAGGGLMEDDGGPSHQPRGKAFKQKKPKTNVIGESDGGLDKIVKLRSMIM